MKNVSKIIVLYHYHGIFDKLAVDKLKCIVTLINASYFNIANVNFGYER